MTALPSGGWEQTIDPTQAQLEALAAETQLDVADLCCTRRQASVWLSTLWSTESYTERQTVIGAMIRQGARAHI